LSPELEGRIISSLSQADQDMSMILDQQEKSPNQEVRKTILLV